MTLVSETVLLCADVAIPVPVPGPFTYTVPDNLKDKLQCGVRVRVPFRNREAVGYIVEVKEIIPRTPLKAVLQILDEKPVLNQNILNLTKWIAEYYGASWGEAIENALPKWVKFGKKAERALNKSQEIAVEEDNQQMGTQHQRSLQKCYQKDREEKGPVDFAVISFPYGAVMLTLHLMKFFIA